MPNGFDTAYTKSYPAWANNPPSTSTPITAAALQHIEDAVYDLKRDTSHVVSADTEFNLVANGTTDNSVSINSALAQGKQVTLASGVYAVANPLVPTNGSGLIILGGATLKWTGASGGTVIANGATNPLQRFDFRNEGIVDLNSAADFLFDLISPQQCEIEVGNVINGKSISVGCRIRTTATNTGFLGSRSAFFNTITGWNIIGPIASVYVLDGSVAAPITLNELGAIQAADVRGTGIDIVDYCDSNNFTGLVRLNLNSATATGLIVNSGTPGVYNGCHSNVFDALSVDSVAPVTGRTGIVLNSSNATAIKFYHGEDANFPAGRNIVTTNLDITGGQSCWIFGRTLSGRLNDTNHLEIFTQAEFTGGVLENSSNDSALDAGFVAINKANTGLARADVKAKTGLGADITGSLRAGPDVVYVGSVTNHQVNLITNNTVRAILGNSTLQLATGYALELASGGPQVLSGSGAPEGSVTAPVGSMYLRTGGGVGTSVYVKEAGAGNTGWAASSTPTGAAGGDLAGTYPNPTIKASVALTGAPTAPTVAVGDNSTSIATTAWVKLQGYGAGGGGITQLTGDVTAGPGSGSVAATIKSSVALAGVPTAATAAVDTNTTQIATTAYVIAQGYLKSATAATTYAPLASPAFTGVPTAPTPTTADNSTKVATTAWVVAQNYGPAGAGGPPSGSAGGDLAGSTYPNPTIKASVGLTGSPTATTATVDTSTTQIATTAFVLGQASAVGDGTPVMDGTAARGTSTHFARADHVHASDTSRAPLASPALTGTPTAPTAAVDTNTTQLATTAFVIAQSYLKTTAVATVAQGGTGVATLTAHGVVIGEGTGNVAVTPAGTAGQILRSGGAAADPAWSTATYPATAGTSGNVLQSDGTNFASTALAIVDANVAAGAAIAWSKVSKTGSSLADLVTRSATDLTSGTLPNARLVSVPVSALAPGSDGQVLLTTGGVPTWGASPSYPGSYPIVNADIASAAAIAWTKIDKTGSSLADLATRSASDLNSGTLPNARLTAVPVTSLAPGTNGQVLTTTGGVAAWGSAGAYAGSYPIVNADISATAAIAYSKLNLTGLIVNADVAAAAAIAYSKLNLATSIVNADVAAGAAIVYSKLNLATSIVNADIAAGAAIVDTKLATISTAGKVSDSALTSNVMLLAGTQTVTGGKTFTTVRTQYGSTSPYRWFLSSELTDRAIMGLEYLNYVSAAGQKRFLMMAAAADTQPVISLQADGTAQLAFGAGGTTAPDTSISRSAAAVLAVTSIVDAATGFRVGGTALAASHLSNGVQGTGAVVLAGSPTLTGTPASTTAAVDTNTTQIATTAFVLAQAASASPAMDGAAAVGTSTRYARGDHVHPSDTSRAALASPTFTGTPLSTTAAVDTNTTQIATTAFVIAQAASVAPVMDGAAAVGTSTRYARQDHVHASDTSRLAATATVGGDLSGTMPNPAIAAGVIVDADVNASAAIAWTKISKTGSSLADLVTRSATDLTSGTIPAARLPVFVASGASHAIGAVPDPGVTANTVKYLREDATWQIPPTGTVTAIDGGSPSAATTIQLRRGTNAQWTATNPILARGEIGWVLDTATGNTVQGYKVGDGLTAWSGLTFVAMWVGGNTDMTGIGLGGVQAYMYGTNGGVGIWPLVQSAGQPTFLGSLESDANPRWYIDHEGTFYTHGTGAGSAFVISNFKIARKIADESIPSSAVVQNDDHLFFTATSGVAYEIELVLIYASPLGGVTPDLKLDLGEDATIRGGFEGVGISTADAVQVISAVGNQTATMTFGTAATKRVATIKGHHVGNGGTFRLRWAQNTSGTNPTIVYTGSLLRYRAIT